MRSIHPQPNAGTAKRIHVMLRMWSEKLNFSIMLVDDFKMVLGMKFFDQVYVFLLPTINF